MDVSIITEESWILHQYAQEIATRIEGTRLGGERGTINYFIPYYLFKPVHFVNRFRGINVVLFTHLEENWWQMRLRWWWAAWFANHCVSISPKYAQLLVRRGIPSTKVSTIIPGYDSERFLPRPIRIGVVGRTYPKTGRKGERLVEKVREQVEGIEWRFAGAGWPSSETIPYEEMPAFYRSLDYLLVPSLWEGGPMPVLEALACGVPVIAPDVGFCWEFPVIRYEKGNAESLGNILKRLVAEKRSRVQSVAPYTWDAWAKHHRELFERLLKANGQSQCLAPVAESRAWITGDEDLTK